MASRLSTTGFNRNDRRYYRNPGSRIHPDRGARRTRACGSIDGKEVGGWSFRSQDFDSPTGLGRDNRYYTGRLSELGAEQRRAEHTDRPIDWK
jgi:hypothetical protein